MTLRLALRNAVLFLSMAFMMLVAGFREFTLAQPLPGAVRSSSGYRGYLPSVAQRTYLRLAVIGDFGNGSEAEHDVATLVKSWSPDLILTTGDNNYPAGEAATIDRNVGAAYHEFIAPYYGRYGPGGSTNRFFPTLGNHDWVTGGQAHFDFFTLPGNERYYDVVVGPVHLFAIDSDPREPDGVSPASIQGRWLYERLTHSAACWKLVYMHHPPFSSGPHGSTEWMQWPYSVWGADAVLAGHDHTYERIMHNNMLYLVNGLGGNTPYEFRTPVEGSKLRFNADVGAMLIEVDASQLTLWFITRTGTVIDSHQLPKQCS